MTRGRTYASIAVLAVAVGIFVSWGAGDRDAAPVRTAEQRAGSQSVGERTRRTLGTAAGLAVADPIGTLRLEGQVLDADEQPVAGARVTVEALPPRTVETEADGSFAFDGMLAKHYTLVAVADTGVAGPTIARLSDRSDPVILRMRPGASADVTVLDGETGRPIAGANVEVRGVPVSAALTGSDGTAVLQPLAPGRWLLVVSAPGYGVVLDSLAASASERTKLTITLARGFRVRGRVIDEAGQPIADAQVWPESTSDFYANRDPERDGTRTASDGSFELSGVARGSYRMLALAANFALGASGALAVDGDTDGVVVKLGRGANLAGRAVHPDGKPATGAVVRAWWAGGGRMAHVDKDGRFELDTMPRSAVWVWARDESSTSKPRRFALDELPAAEAQAVKLVLDQEGVIAGVVVDSRGEPIEGAQVIARRLEAVEGLPALAEPELTDAGGQFTVAGLVAGEYRLVAARDPRQLRASGAQVVVATGTRDVRLTLETEGSITGQVFVRDGGAPASFSVRLGRRGLPKTFAGGRFEIDAAPGKHTLLIDGPGFVAASVEGVEVKASAVTDLGRITVDRGRMIRGRVVGPTASITAGAQVLAGTVLTGTGARVEAGGDGPSLGGEVKRVSAGAQGEFVIEGAGSRSLSLVAVSTAGRSSPVTIPAGNDDVTGVTLTLSPEARLSGTVLVAGKPTPAVVNAQPHASPLAMMTAMASSGEYAFDHLAPGTYSVAAVTGDPYGGSPFYPRVVTLVAGARASLDLPIAPGPDLLTVKTPGIDSGLVFITTRPGAATRAVAMVEELGRQDGGQWAVAPVRDGGAAFRELATGEVRACLVPMPGMAGRPAGALVEAMFRSGASLALSCVTAVSGSTVTLQPSGSVSHPLQR